MSGKKVGVMQPYIFPYLGYFQLIEAVDTFVFYDDVDYIKGGWINRNRILVNGRENIFTLPLASASSNKKINETVVNPHLYDRWRNKFMRTLEQAYAKAPFASEVKVVVGEALSKKSTTIAEKAAESVLAVCKYLDINKDFKFSSENYPETRQMSRTERLINICKKDGAKDYINSIGGRELYCKEVFEDHGLTLRFLSPHIPVYKQSNADFISGLSIIDILMFNDKEEVRKMFEEYTLE